MSAGWQQELKAPQSSLAQCSVIDVILLRIAAPFLLSIDARADKIFGQRWNQWEINIQVRYTQLLVKWEFPAIRGPYIDPK